MGIADMKEMAPSLMLALICSALARGTQEESVRGVCHALSDNRILAWEKCHDMRMGEENGSQQEENGEKTYKLVASKTECAGTETSSSEVSVQACASKCTAEWFAFGRQSGRCSGSTCKCLCETVGKDCKQVSHPHYDLYKNGGAGGEHGAGERGNDWFQKFSSALAKPTNAPVTDPTGAPIADPTGAPIAAPTGAPTKYTGKCNVELDVEHGEKPCVTCADSGGSSCTSCQQGHFLNVKKVDGRVQIGQCLDASKAVLNTCVVSECHDAEHGLYIKHSSTHVVCSRICKFGGEYTRTKNMKRKGPDNSVTIYKDEKFALKGGWSPRVRYLTAPECVFHKVIYCRRSKEGDAAKCRSKCKDLKRSVAKRNCVRRYCEKCRVRKSAHCHAIVPAGWGNRVATKEQQDECKYAIDPCVNIARML